MGSFEAPVMGLLQSESLPSAGAADTQLHTTAAKWADVALNLWGVCFCSTATHLALKTPLLHQVFSIFSFEAHVLDYANPHSFVLRVISAFCGRLTLLQLATQQIN